jgi:cobalamin biosynthesis protein CobT
MASVQSPLGYRSIRRTIRQQAKAVLVANDMRPSTKRGNREFRVALNRLAMQPYESLDTAAQVGQELGQKIVDLSKAKDKGNLDAGIIRQMVLTGEIPTVPKTTQKLARSAQVTVAPLKAKAETTTPAPVEPEPAAAEESAVAVATVEESTKTPVETAAKSAAPTIDEAEETEEPPEEEAANVVETEETDAEEAAEIDPADEAEAEPEAIVVDEPEATEDEAPEEVSEETVAETTAAAEPEVA